MFLSAISEEYGLHELDFRFEYLADGSQFLFAHHGLSLSDLAETLDLSCLGSYLSMVEARHPFTLEEIIANPSLFEERYRVRPTVAFGRYLGFDVSDAAQFFRGTRSDNELDCIMLGFQRGQLSETEFDQVTQPFSRQDGPC